MRFRVGTFQKVLFLLLDAAALTAAAYLLASWRFGAGEAFPWGRWTLVVLLPSLGCLYVFGTYSFEEVRRQRMLLLQFLLALLAALVVSQAIVFMWRLPVSGLFGRGVLLGSIGLGFAVTAVLRLWEFSRIRRGQRSRKVVFCGTEGSFESLKKAMEAIGFRGELSRAEVPSGPEALQDVALLVIDRALQERQPESFRRALAWRFAGLRVVELPSFFEAAFQKVNVDEIDGTWFLSFEGFGLVQSRLQRRLKRLMDFLLSLLLLIFTLPLVAAAGGLIWLSDRGPVFYRQRRTGLDGKNFDIIKLRTMRVDAEKTGAQWAREKDPRVTAVGSFLRKSRIDELPQLWNVLKGEMSFVGPRPERPEFNEMLEAKIPFYGARHVMPPGITGWAQVMYPYGASVEDAKEKLQYDLFYIKNYTLILDFRILAKTARVVFLGRGR